MVTLVVFRRELCRLCVPVHILTYLSVLWRRPGHMWMVTSVSVCEGCTELLLHVIGLCAAPLGIRSTFHTYHFTSKESSLCWDGAVKNWQRDKEERKNIFTSKSLFGIKWWRAGWALLARFDHAALLRADWTVWLTCTELCPARVGWKTLDNNHNHHMANHNVQVHYFQNS